MKPKTLLMLSLLTLGLGLFIAFYERDLQSTDERRVAEKKVLAVEADTITGIEIVNGQGRRIRLEKEEAVEEQAQDPLSKPPEVWRLTQPIQARADTDGLTDLISRLTSIEKSRTLNSPELSQLGLDQPELSVTLHTESGPKELHIGMELPLSGDRALRGNATDVAYQARIDPDLLDLMGRDAPDWRDKRIFFEPRNAIETLALVRGDQEIRLQRFGDDEKYRLVEPVADAANADKVRGLLTALVGLEAAAFVDPETAAMDLGLEPAQARLEVGLAEGSKPWLLELGFPRTDDPGRLWARYSSADESQTVEISSPELEEALAGSVDAWRSPQWSAFQVFGIRRARFSGAGKDLEIERQDNGDWSRDGDRIEYSAASDALYPFTEIQAESLVGRKQAEARFDLSRPRLTATLSDGEREEVLHLYPGDDELAPASLEGRDTVLLIDSAAADDLMDNIEALRNAPTVVETLQE